MTQVQDSIERTSAPVVGDTVTYVDPVGVHHSALVTANWGASDNFYPSINLVFVSTDEAKSDTYGRQIERSTSVVHHNNQYAPGNYWF